MVEKNNIVQVTNKDSHWFPCLVIVSEMKNFGIQGYTTIPMKGDAYIRLNKDDYEKVGTALVIAE